MAEGLVTQAEAPGVRAPVSGPSVTAPENMPPPMQDGMERGEIGMSGNPGGAQEIPATPEDQEAYNAALNFAGAIVHGNDTTSDGVVKILMRGGQQGAVESISQIVVMLMAEIETQFQGQIPETVILPAADEITDLVMELGEEAGAFQLTDDDINKAKGQVVRMLIDTYGVDKQQMSGITQNVTEEDIQKYTEIFGVKGIQ